MLTPAWPLGGHLGLLDHRLAWLAAILAQPVGVRQPSWLGRVGRPYWPGLLGSISGQIGLGNETSGGQTSFSPAAILAWQPAPTLGGHLGSVPRLGGHIVLGPGWLAVAMSRLTTGGHLVWLAAMLG